MVTSPSPFFPRDYSANFIITDEGRDMLHRNLVTNEGRSGFHTPTDTLAMFTDHISSGSVAGSTTQNGFDWYGGCRKCYQFSMLFGDASNNIGHIDSEEDFEKYKMQFVDHYNEKHKDLYAWRKKKIGKKPITDEKNIETLKGRAGFNSIFGSSMFSPAVSFAAGGTIDDGDAGIIERINGVDIITTAEPRPEITDEDHAVIWELEATGDITDENRERLKMKYGESIIIKALKKYRDRTTPRRGWRDQGRSVFLPR